MMIAAYMLSFVILLLCIIGRYFEYRQLIRYGLDNNSSGTDVSTQFFYFIKALTQQSLCPSEFNNKFKDASLYYPLGIYWISINIALVLSKSNRKLITLADLKDKNNYASLALRICIAINLLIIPALLEVCLAVLPYMLIDNYIYSTLLSVFLVTYMDQYLPSINYPVQTRSIGFFCSAVFALFLIVSFQENYNPLDLGFIFNTTNYPIDNSLGFASYLIGTVFSISVLSSLIFVCIRSSQQGSQFLISLLVASCLISNNILTGSVALSAFLAINMPMFQPSLETFNFFRAHIFNRLNDNIWYLSTYGVQKYKLLSLTRLDLKESFKSILSFNIIARSAHHARYKRSWLSQLIENRILLYSFIALFYGFVELKGVMISNDSSFNLLFLFTAACIVPSALCCFRIFQGYGPPLHYIEFFTPFNWFALILYLHVNEVNNIYSNIILMDLFICSLVLTYESFKANKANKEYKENEKSLSTIDKFILKKERVILEYINQRVDAKSIANHRFAIVKGHYQMVLECGIVLYSNQYSKTISSKFREMHSFPIVDSQHYSFYHHWYWIYTKPVSIIKNKVTCLFIDSSNPEELNYIPKLKTIDYFKNWKILKADINEMIMFVAPDITKSQ